jgi:hypothetical protein
MKLGQTVIPVIFGLGVIGLAQVASAEPLAISMTQRDGRVSSETCMNEAKTALQRRNFKNIDVGENSIKGDYQDYLAIISCYEVTTVKGVLVQSVVVTGPVLSGARQLRDELLKAID